VEPGWIIGAVGLVFGAIGFWRGRRMDHRLQTMEGLLAALARKEPVSVVRRVAETGELREPAAGLGRRLSELSERDAAMIHLLMEGAKPSEAAKAFGVSEASVTRRAQRLTDWVIYGGERPD
jgi:hypothetical protein